MLTTRLLAFLCFTLCCVSATALALKTVRALREGHIHWYRGSRHNAVNWRTFQKVTDPRTYWDGIAWCLVGCLAFFSMAVYMLAHLPEMVRAGL